MLAKYFYYIYRFKIIRTHSPDPPQIPWAKPSISADPPLRVSSNRSCLTSSSESRRVQTSRISDDGTGVGLNLAKEERSSRASSPDRSSTRHFLVQMAKVAATVRAPRPTALTALILLPGMLMYRGPRVSILRSPTQ